MTITKITILEYFTSRRLLYIPVAYGTDEVFMQGKIARRKKHSFKRFRKKKCSLRISSAIWDKSARVNFSKTNKILVFEKFTSADLSQIARENHVTTC